MFALHPASYPAPLHHPPSPPMDSNSMAPVPPTAALRSPSDPQKPRKMRASCDACSRAKVKCDKVRPTCHRCGNNGFACHYSPSMRLGKPRKPRNADGTIQRDASPAGMISRMGSRPDMRPDMIPRTAASTTSSSPEPNDPYMYGPATPEAQFIDCPDVFMTGFEGNQSPYSDTGSFAASNWQGDDIPFHSPLESPFKFNQPMVPHQFPPTSDSYTPAHVRSTSVHSHPDMFRPMDTMPPSPPIPAPPFFGMEQQQPLPVYSPPKEIIVPTPAAPAPLPTPPTSATLQNHDCTQFAFSTLNSLCTPPTDQPSASDFGASGNLPTLQAVLQTNKSAIDKVFVLLGCPCSSNPHFSTTIAFTIIKILSWYQAVGGMNQPQTDSPIITQMETFTHPSHSHSHSHSSITNQVDLESEDDTLRTNHILNELRRVEKLVGKFAERYCKSSTTNGIDGGVYGSLEHMLRTRVRDTLKITMRNAPEELRRRLTSTACSKSAAPLLVQRQRHNTIS